MEETSRKKARADAFEFSMSYNAFALIFILLLYCKKVFVFVLLFIVTFIYYCVFMVYNIRLDNIISIFANIEDFITGNAKKHKLGDIVIIAIAAVISQCSSWYEIEEYGVDNEEWFRSFLELPNGIPSHDTFNRVISILPPETLEACLRQWADAVAPNRKGRVVATDGKTIKGVGSKANPLQSTSRWMPTMDGLKSATAMSTPI